jgi:hypothetical protein
MLDQMFIMLEPIKILFKFLELTHLYGYSQLKRKPLTEQMELFGQKINDF